MKKDGRASPESIRRVIFIVEKSFSLQPGAVASPDQSSHVVRARGMAMWIVRKGLKASWSQIKLEFNRDNSTSITRIQSFSELLKVEPDWARYTQQVVERIKQAQPQLLPIADFNQKPLPDDTPTEVSWGTRSGKNRLTPVRVFVQQNQRFSRAMARVLEEEANGR